MTLNWEVNSLSSNTKIVGQCCLCNKDIYDTCFGISGVKLKDGNYLCIKCSEKVNVDS